MTFDLAVEALVNNVPSDWRVLPFRRLAEPVESTNAAGTAPLLSLASTGELAPREEFSGLGRQAPSDETIERYWLALPDDLVVNPMWLIGGGIGVSRLRGGVSPDYRVYRLGPDLHPRYVHHLLRSAPYRDQYRLYTRAETTFDRRVSKVDFHAMPILVPPLDEQLRIADFLDAETARVDGLSEARRQMLALLELRRERMVEGVLGLDVSSPAVPLKYAVRSVGVGIVINPSRWYVDERGVPALRGLNVQPGCIRNADLVYISHAGHLENQKSRLSGGDVVVVRTGQAGAAAVVPGDLHGCNCIDLLIIRPGDRTSPSFLSYFLNSHYAQEKISEFSVGSIQSHFNVGAMKNLPFPSLELAEQERRVSDLDEIVNDIDSLNRQIETQLALLTERRQALITAAVTGQVDVTTAKGVAV